MAAPDKTCQVEGFRRGDFALDPRQRIFQLQTGAIEIAVGLLENADLRRPRNPPV